MTDVQLKLKNAKTQLEWIRRLLERLDEHTPIPVKPGDLGSDGEPDPPTFEDFECRVIWQSRPWTIRTVKDLADAAIRDIEPALPPTGA